MSDSSYLSGKVRKKTLRFVQGPSEPGAEIVKRLLLPQGELAQFYDASEPVHYIAYIEFRDGFPRGNHYHKVKAETLYVIDGEIVVTVEDVVSKERASLSMAAGDLLEIPVGVAHAFQSKKSGRAIEFSPGRFDASDTHRYPLV